MSSPSLREGGPAKGWTGRVVVTLSDLATLGHLSLRERESSREVISVPDYTAAMDQALVEARLAVAHDDVPIGAVVLDSSGAVVAADHNRREQRNDATAHAEMLVLSAASRELGDWRLTGHTLVVTLEPCAMCAMAAVWARVERIVYAAADLKAGGAWSLFNIPQDERLNHRCDVVTGVRAEEAKKLLEEFFVARR